MTDTTSDHNPAGTDTPKDQVAEVAALRAANKTALFEALTRAGIDQVTVRFDGYGDSGQIEEVEAIAGGRSVNLPSDQIEISRVRWYAAEPPSIMSLREAVEESAYACLDQIQSGWENDEGAYGDVVFEVAARTITLDFNGRFTDVNASQHSF